MMQHADMAAHLPAPRNNATALASLDGRNCHVGFRAQRVTSPIQGFLPTLNASIEELTESPVRDQYILLDGGSTVAIIGK
jgi:hypothetical protein